MPLKWINLLVVSRQVETPECNNGIKRKNSTGSFSVIKRDTLSEPKQGSMSFCRVRIKSSMFYREKLYEHLLVLASSCERPLCLSLTDRRFCSFTCCRLLENVISNVN